MNTIEELKVQNQQDFLSMLYISVAKQAQTICGRRGTECIGKGIRNAGRTYGEALRKFLVEQAIPTNFETLFVMEPYCWADPRMRTKTLELTPEVMRYEVYTCPFADTCRDAGAGDLGNMFCEQWHRGLVGAFTQDVDKFYLTKKLTVHRTNGCRPDNHCKFSIFYRCALTQGTQRQESFPDTAKVSADQLPMRSVSEKLHIKYVLLLTSWIDILKQDLGNEGLCAAALALRSLVDPTAEMMLHYADMRLAKDIGIFTKENLPIASDEKALDEEWADWGSEEAKKIFLVNFYRPLHKKLGIE